MKRRSSDVLGQYSSGLSEAGRRGASTHAELRVSSRDHANSTQPRPTNTSTQKDVTLRAVTKLNRAFRTPCFSSVLRPHQKWREPHLSVVDAQEVSELVNLEFSWAVPQYGFPRNNSTYGQ